MKRLRLLIRAFFGFSRTETNAFVILLPLILVLLFSEPLYRQFYLDRDSFIFDIDRTDSLLASMDRKYPDSLRASKPVSKTAHFYPFDPNMIQAHQYVSFGLPEKVASRIERYREKGGRFFKKEDLLRIYGMDTGWFLQAKKWITIPPVLSQNKKPERKIQSREVLDINVADSTQLLAVYGIGPVLSKRILTFRDKLGGFISMDQLKEIYGLDTSVVLNMKKRFIVSAGFHPRTINLNTATLEELDSHPYISRKEAQAIITYRLPHQAFLSIDQLGEIKLLDQKWVDRVRPYFTIE